MSFTPAKRTLTLALLLLMLLAVAFFVRSALNRHQFRTDDAWCSPTIRWWRRRFPAMSQR